MIIIGLYPSELFLRFYLSYLVPPSLQTPFHLSLFISSIFPSFLPHSFPPSSPPFLSLTRYNVFEVGAPTMQYNITISLLEFSGVIKNEDKSVVKANWTLVSQFNLNPSKTLGRSANGRVYYVKIHM